MALVISSAVRHKLSEKNPPITEEDIAQCFANRTGRLLIDDREQNLTNPLTRWFISETDYGLTLKICFIPYNDGRLVVKTAYVPNKEEVGIYETHGAK